jgi:hypothetical protein
VNTHPVKRTSQQNLFFRFYHDTFIAVKLNENTAKPERGIFYGVLFIWSETNWNVELDLFTCYFLIISLSNKLVNFFKNIAVILSGELN